MSKKPYKVTGQARCVVTLSDPLRRIDMVWDFDVDEVIHTEGVAKGCKGWRFQHRDTMTFETRRLCTEVVKDVTLSLAVNGWPTRTYRFSKIGPEDTFTMHLVHHTGPPTTLDYRPLKMKGRRL